VGEAPNGGEETLETKGEEEYRAGLGEGGAGTLLEVGNQWEREQEPPESGKEDSESAVNGGRGKRKEG